MGLVHTSIRSKLGVDKVRKTTMVGMDIKQTHLEAGLLRVRGKRNFTSVTSQAGEQEPNRDHETIDNITIGDADDFLDFDQLSEHLIKSAAAANNDKDVGDVLGDSDAEDEGNCFESSAKSTHLPYTIRLPPLSSATLSNQATQATKTSIPLQILFKYPSDVGPSLEGTNSDSSMNSFWKGGIQNLENEMESYERLSSSEEEVDGNHGINLEVQAMQVGLGVI